MSIYKKLSYDQDISKVLGIQFAVMSGEEIKQRSVAEILTTNTYSNDEPALEGLFDPRMGVIDRNKSCLTCKQQNDLCPGHFGHIVLAKPCFYWHYLGTIKKILKCVCFRCSKILLDKSDPKVIKLMNSKLSKKGKFVAIEELSKNIKYCQGTNGDGCGATMPSKIDEKSILGKIVLTWSTKNKDVVEDENNKVEYFASDVLRILSRITDEDSRLIGFPPEINRPENMICTIFPVCPPAVRPSDKNDMGQRCFDDLTNFLCDIIKNNNNLRKIIENKKTNQFSYNAAYTLLQFYIFAYVDNTTPSHKKITKRTGLPLKSIIERIKGKTGRIRGNLMGKRVDFSARSVITPDPNIGINELGVPIQIAMNLTFPERVNDMNRDRLMDAIKNGPFNYPGAKYIYKTNEGGGRKIMLRGLDITTIYLENGDIVERHLNDGDYVLFNRQPTLHKMSMMAHKIKVLPYNTFRLNIMVTPPYNADFDGDEMNMHVPQSEQSMNELRMLARVQELIIAPKNSSPEIAVVQDAVTGIYRITDDEVRVSEKSMFNLIMTNSYFKGLETLNDFKFIDKDLRLLSTIIPKNISINMKNKSEDKVEVNNGIIKKGKFDKEIYQKQTSGLVHSVFMENGSEYAKKLFNNTQTLICDWLVLSGFSVGLSDLQVSEEKRQNMDEIINKMREKAYLLVKSVHMGEYVNETFLSDKDAFEHDMKTILGEAGKELEKQITNVDDKYSYNRMLDMIKSGAKGGNMNIRQMVAGLGQQDIEGRRVPDSFNNRSLPHYTKYNYNPESRGFVTNSFIDGLTPQEFYFHAMAGRIGLVSTAVKTAETGYIQRKLIKALEDCKIAHDLTIRNANGIIVQFLYGEDGMGSNKLEKHKLFHLDKKIEELEKMYMFRQDDILKNLFSKKVEEKVKSEINDWEPKMFEHFNQILNDIDHMKNKVFRGSNNDIVIYPVAINRYIIEAKNLFHKYRKRCDMDISYVLDELKKLEDELYLLNEGVGNNLINILIRMNLSPKRVIIELGLNKTSFEYIVKKIKNAFYNAIAHPGEMVGVLAAQSIGEPTTQLTLNLFHVSGQAKASQSVSGVPRIKELLDITKNIKGPSTTIYLIDNVKRDVELVNMALNSMETTYIRDVVKRYDIYYEPVDSEADINNDDEFMKLYKIFEDVKGENKSPFLLRFEFDPIKMAKTGVSMIDIHNAIYRGYSDNIVNCYMSDDNSEEMVIRIQLNDENITNDDMVSELTALRNSILENCVINGIEGIKKIVKDKKTINNKDNSDIIEYTLDVNGLNLNKILGHPCVDSKKTISNHIFEVYETLGIEAARQVLLNEFEEVFVHSNVGYRHLTLLVDMMTNKGTLMSIHRKDTNRSDIGPLAKCSFEESNQMLINAAIFSEYDKMTGVSANTMLGQQLPCGTGDVKLLLDHEKLMNIVNDDELMENNLINKDVIDNCEMDDLDFKIYDDIDDIDVVEEYNDILDNDEIITTFT
jgi:DNA-directed RNA polymerase II subunit RPB1